MYVLLVYVILVFKIDVLFSGVGTCRYNLGTRGFSVQAALFTNVSRFYFVCASVQAGVSVHCRYNARKIKILQTT